jgi:hypothetical protein
MNNCGWCGKVVEDEPVLSYEQGPIVHGESKVEEEIFPGFRVGFCCDGCAWAFYFKIHEIFGLGGKELRLHLIDEDGLKYPPGKPAGNQSVDCYNRFRGIALSMIKAFNFDGSNN